jgi:uncharacterized membrane protein YgdD (TMEM256/DUF423 family)
LAGRYWICIGAVLAGLGVGLGAIGAHFLKSLIAKGLFSGDQLVTFETAVRYQMYHSLAIVLAGLIIERHSNWALQGAAGALLLGIVLFSGGLYGWLAADVKPLVHVVPVGGMVWIVGWLLLALGAVLPAARYVNLP